MVIAYVAKLNEISEARRGEQQARREEQARSAAEATRERLTPLDKRLERLLATIPVEVQLEGFSLRHFKPRCAGAGGAMLILVKSGEPFAGLGLSGDETGAALRVLRYLAEDRVRRSTLAMQR